MRTNNVLNIIPANTVMNTTINSTPMQLYQIYSYAIQVVFTGTPNGTFSLQASCDPVPQATTHSITAAPTPTNWTTISGSNQTVSAAGSVIWNAQDIAYNWVRVTYSDASSGSSTATITVSTFNSKGI